MPDNDRVSLTFSPANTKTKKLAKALGLKPSQVWGFSLPAGWTCPGADRCLSKADPDTGKITDGKHCEFRCFAASMESIYPATRNMVWRNYEALCAVGLTDHQAMADLILRDLPANAKAVRVHVSGDFFNDRYIHAWVIVAESRPDVVFYAYTKNLIAFLPFATLDAIPPNLRITYSDGGKWDNVAAECGAFPTAYVVHSPDDAARRGLPIDHNDTMAYRATEDFALLIHGPQPKGTPAAKASYANRVRGK